MTAPDTDTLAELLAKITPGPWAAEGPLQSIIVWGPEPELRVCFMTSDGPARPNSKLIAIAPELAARVIALEAQEAKDKAELAEARRRRDEWRKKAEGYDAVCLALREKVGDPWPPHLSRVMWAGLAAAEKKRADDAEARIERLEARLAAAEAGEDALAEALRLQQAWSDSESAGPNYGGQKRNTHPDGERIWSEWWWGNLSLCARAQEATRAALAAYEARSKK